MRFFTTAVALLSLVTATLSALTVDKYPGAPSGRYLVQVKDGHSKDDLIARIQRANGQVTNNWSIINGFAGNFDTTVLNIILESPEVQAITEDGVATTLSLQSNAPWGLRRISNRDPLPAGSDPKSLTYNYAYPNGELGRSADIYIVDTGVRITHKTFQERAVWGKTFGGYADQDGNGHGTHVAGTAAGYEYGVAKRAKIIAVKVLSDEGSGAYSDIIDALQWVQSEVARTRKPSVVNMSLGGPPNLMFDQTVQSLIKSGIHVAVAAGNSFLPAETGSPAREPTACTVGASDINDAMASFSNWGPSVDIFAPGVDITSAWITDDEATNSISGTSMATPHIAGLIAYLITAEGNPAVTPAEMVSKLRSYAVKGKLTSVPPTTDNLLAQNRRP